MIPSKGWDNFRLIRIMFSNLVKLKYQLVRVLKMYYNKRRQIKRLATQVWLQVYGEMKLKIRHINKQNKDFSYIVMLIHEALYILMLPELCILKEMHFILDVECWRWPTSIAMQPPWPRFGCIGWAASPNKVTLSIPQVLIMSLSYISLCRIIFSGVSDISAITSLHQLPKRSKSLFFLPAETWTNELVSNFQPP